MVRNRRRRKLIRLDLQLKIVFITLFVASLVLLIHFQLSLAGVWGLEHEYTQHYDIDLLMESMKTSTIHRFLLSAALAVPLATFVGILYSFRFCGPIYKFKKYLSELATERWDERCMLRKGDDLQDVCDAINEGVGALRERIRDSHAVLQDVKRLLDSGAVQEDDATRELVERLRAGVAEEESCFAAHFGTASGASSSTEEESACREPELEAQV